MFLCNIFYNHHSLLPHAFADCFTPINQIHNYNTHYCRNCKLFLPSAFSESCNKMLRFIGNKIWTKISTEIKDNLNINYFLLITIIN